MLLGGFLKQMNDTIRYNLDLREKLRRKPTKNFGKARHQKIQESKTISETERRELLSALREGQENEKRKNRIALVISLLLTLTLFYFVWQIFF